MEVPDDRRQRGVKEIKSHFTQTWKEEKEELIEQEAEGTFEGLA